MLSDWERIVGNPQRDTLLKKVVELRRVVLGYTVGIVGSPEMAEDVYQETAVVVCNKAHQFRPDGNLRAWILEIARRTALDMLRKHSRNSVLSAEALDALAADEDAQAAAEAPFCKQRALDACMGQLSDKARTLLRRRYAEDTPCEAMAKKDKRPLNTIYVALSRIRTQLRECIERRMASEATA